MSPTGRKGFYPASRSAPRPRSRGLKRLLKVIVSAVILTVIGVLFIVYNRHDGSMVGFGWFLVVMGAIIAAVFTILLMKGLAAGPEPEPEPKRRRDRR